MSPSYPYLRYTPSNMLANLHQHLGINPSITIPDHNRRPVSILDDRRLVQELLPT